MTTPTTTTDRTPHPDGVPGCRYIDCGAVTAARVDVANRIAEWSKALNAGDPTAAHQVNHRKAAERFNRLAKEADRAGCWHHTDEYLAYGEGPADDHDYDTEADITAAAERGADAVARTWHDLGFRLPG